jgi:hypothetical protein
MHKEGAVWLYCLPWFGPGNANPSDWMRTSYNHERMLTLDELPKLAPHNTAPNVRLTQPADGAEVPGATVEIKGVATDRDGNLDRVEILLVREPWRNWCLRDDDAVAELVGEAKRLGDARPGADGRWALHATNVPAGCWNIVALAHDGANGRARSSFARVAIGLKNLARGRPVSASSDEPNAARAVDGDLFTSWQGDAKEPQWLAVDLGSVQPVGAVVVSWWKAYASDYEVQASADGMEWQTVGRIEKKRGFHGDSDVFRFAPVQARHVRVHATKLATTWGGYSVFDVAVFPSIPESPEPQKAAP